MLKDIAWADGNHPEGHSVGGWKPICNKCAQISRNHHNRLRSRPPALIQLPPQQPRLPLQSPWAQPLEGSGPRCAPLAPRPAQAYPGSACRSVSGGNWQRRPRDPTELGKKPPGCGRGRAAALASLANPRAPAGPPPAWPRAPAGARRRCARPV